MENKNIELETKENIPLYAPKVVKETETKINFSYSSAPVKKEPVSTQGLFFCCGDNIDEHKY